METRYHINPETGKPNICRATGKRGCKYKGSDGREPEHYATKEEAQAGYEREMRGSTLISHSLGDSHGGELPNTMAMLSNLATTPREITLDDLEEDEELESLLRELDALDGEVYPGKLREATTMDEKLEQYYQLSTDLVMDNIDLSDGSYEPPVTEEEEIYDEESGDYWIQETADAPPGFRFLGAGASNNAYLHEATGMVYKIPNAEGVAALWNENSSGLQREMVVLEQKAYALLDKRALEEMNMEYVETTFLQVRDPSGLAVPVVVQPHLSPREYKHVQLSNDTINAIRQAGFPLDDLRSVNMFQHRGTGRIVMFDCLNLPLDVNI